MPEGESPKVATVRMRVRYLLRTMQEAIDCGVNGFGAELLAESLGDKDKLTDGGVMLAFPFDHKRRPIWIVVTSEAPFIEEDQPI